MEEPDLHPPGRICPSSWNFLSTGRLWARPLAFGDAPSYPQLQYLVMTWVRWESLQRIAKPHCNSLQHRYRMFQGLRVGWQCCGLECRTLRASGSNSHWQHSDNIADGGWRQLAHWLMQRATVLQIPHFFSFATPMHVSINPPTEFHIIYIIYIYNIYIYILIYINIY